MRHYRRGIDPDDQSDHEDLWQELAERICHVPGPPVLRPGDPHRAFHQDLPLLNDLDLALEKQRAILRACLERDSVDRHWLIRRITFIEDEQAQRGEAGKARPPLPPASLAAPPSELSAVAARGAADAQPRSPTHGGPAADRPNRPQTLADEEDRVREWRQHQEWLLHQHVAALSVPGHRKREEARRWRVIPGGRHVEQGIVRSNERNDEERA